MRILGIELGGWSIKATELESRFRKLEILDFHEVRLPLYIEDPVSTYKTGIEKLLARLPSHPEKIVTSLPASQTAIRFLKIPIKQRKKVEKMFRFDLEDNIPFDLDDTIVEHHVDRLDNSSLVFTAIAPIHQVKQHIEWLNSVGLDPDWLTFEGMGLINFYLQQTQPEPNPEEPKGPTLLIDLGHTKSNLTFFLNQKIMFFRSISWGGASLNHDLASVLNLPLEKIEDLKTNHFQLDADPKTLNAEAQALHLSATQSFFSLVTDIHHSLVAFRAQHKLEISEILITGGTSLTKGIENFLSTNLKKPVSQLNNWKSPIEHPEKYTNKETIRFAESIGRATVFARKSNYLFNFRKEELAKATSLTAATALVQDPHVVRLAKYSLALLAILWVYVIATTPIAKRDAENQLEILQKVFTSVFRDIPKKAAKNFTENPETLEAFIERQQNAINRKLEVATKSRTPMVHLIREVSDAFPKTVKVDVNTLTIDERQFVLEGVLYEGDLETITKTLNQSNNFENVILNLNGQRFTYRGNLVGR